MIQDIRQETHDFGKGMEILYRTIPATLLEQYKDAYDRINGLYRRFNPDLFKLTLIYEGTTLIGFVATAKNSDGVAEISTSDGTIIENRDWRKYAFYDNIDSPYPAVVVHAADIANALATLRWMATPEAGLDWVDEIVDATLPADELAEIRRTCRLQLAGLSTGAADWVWYYHRTMVVNHTAQRAGMAGYVGSCGGIEGVYYALNGLGVDERAAYFGRVRLSDNTTLVDKVFRVTFAKPQNGGYIVTEDEKYATSLGELVKVLQADNVLEHVVAICERTDLKLFNAQGFEKNEKKFDADVWAKDLISAAQYFSTTFPKHDIHSVNQLEPK